MAYSRVIDLCLVAGLLMAGLPVCSSLSLYVILFPFAAFGSMCTDKQSVFFDMTSVVLSEVIHV